MKRANESVVTCPAPEGAALSDQYAVKVNGKPLDVYAAPVWEPDYVKPFGGPYAFAYFDFSGCATVEIECRRSPANTRILPESCGIQPGLSGGRASFILTEPGQFSFEPDAKNGPLLLFANPLESDSPQPDDPGVIYFGPGMHEAGEIRVGDGQTLYIAGGAVVRGGVHAQGDNIRIRGRGILDGLGWERFKGPTRFLLQLMKCSHARVEGVILKDSWNWTFPMYACRNVHIANVKIVSARCENNDGIGVCNSQDVAIENCFVRTDDDCITAKGFGERLELDPYPPVQNVTVERCALWTDRAHIWRLGCECRAEAMRGLVFRDIDVLHYTDPTCPAITVQPAEGMLMENVRFENIRFNGEGQRRFIEVTTQPTQWAKQQTPGSVRNVVFRNMALSGPEGEAMIEIAGSDADHTVEGITFENVVCYGRPLALDSPHIVLGENTKDILFI